MKTLILILSLLTATATQAQTKDNCVDALNAIAFKHAYERLCGGSAGQLNYDLGNFKLHGCTNFVSLNEIRYALARDMEQMTQLQYQANDPYFCQNEAVNREYSNSVRDFIKAMNKL